MDVSDEPDPPLHDNRISGASPASGTVRMRSLSTDVLIVFHVKHLSFSALAAPRSTQRRKPICPTLHRPRRYALLLILDTHLLCVDAGAREYSCRDAPNTDSLPARFHLIPLRIIGRGGVIDLDTLRRRTVLSRCRIRTCRWVCSVSSLGIVQSFAIHPLT